MSLLAWYPLNGDYKNYGLLGDEAPFIVEKEPTYTTGKIGKGLAIGQFHWTADVAEQILGHKQLTICYWWKNLSTGTDRSMVFGNDPMGSNGGRKFSLFRYPDRNSFHQSWQWDSDVESTAAGNSKASGGGVVISDFYTHYKFAL